MVVGGEKSDNTFYIKQRIHKKYVSKIDMNTDIETPVMYAIDKGIIVISGGDFNLKINR